MIAALPLRTYELLRRLGDETKVELRERIARGDPIDDGARHVVVFNEALKALRRGLSAEQALERALEVNTTFVQPYPEKLVRKHWRGAVRFAASHPTEEELAHAEAERLADQAERGEMPAAAPKPKARKVQRRAVAGVEMRPVEYLDGRRAVPLRTLTAIVGEGGLGKGGVVLSWAADVTRRGEAALIITYEDAIAEVVAPRFEAAGGDRERLFELAVDLEDGVLVLPADLGEVHEHAVETSARLLVLDPVAGSVDPRLDSHRDAHMRTLYGQLAKMADAQGLAVVLVAHLNKLSGSADPYLRVGGSVALYNACRSVLSLTRCPVDPEGQRILAQHKNNYARRVDTERWRVEPTLVAGPHGPIETVAMRYVGTAEDVDRDTVLGRPDVARETAEELLRETLADGPMASADVKAAAGRAGVSERTLKRAASLLVDVSEQPTPTGRATFWTLKEGVGPPPTSLVGPTPGPTPSGRMVEPNPGTLEGGSGQSSDALERGPTLDDELRSTRCPKHPDGHLWLDTANVWRCRACDGPAIWQRNVVATETHPTAEGSS
jgi:hypothetical protein